MLWIQLKDGEYQVIYQCRITTTFKDYIKTQEEHVTQYYTQINFIMVPHKIYKLLKSTRKVLIATDGGAIPM
jgi:hypothetical protein